MWRWQALLPVFETRHMLTLGEGDTPLLHMGRLGQQLGITTLFVKDESLNPTGTFKARGLASAVSKAHELGLHKVIIPTAGNAGGAMAAYAARAGLLACVIMPQDAPKANVDECRILGAEVILVDGLISDAARLAKEKATTEGWYDLSTFKEPYRLEGKKVMGFELAEAFQWELPEVIIYPTGGGTGLVGMWKAFAELESLGWLEKTNRPRLVSVQAAGCAPIVKAFEMGSPTSEYWENAFTRAAGLRVPKSFADRLILEDIRLSHGQAIAVSDAEIIQAQRRLAVTEGIFGAPEGAATLAGLMRLIDEGWIQPGERVVLFNTGSGLKYL
jgi:threonine synthase